MRSPPRRRPSQILTSGVIPINTLDPSGAYCAYLRKSRRDAELEALGQGETLARHEQQLRELAARLGIRIAAAYREIVSGDTIAERPEMRRLLADVSAGLWHGVLVMDVDRLARGDSIDQGMIMQTMLYACVLVVTPGKIYDPADDADAEFFELKLFLSRREYVAINRRMQRGRLASAMDGCYMGSRPVYGYERVKCQGRRGWTLRPVPDKAEIVRAVFGWYADGMDGREAGAALIAARLNAMGLRTDLGHPFEASYIRRMLQNPAYIGKTRWLQRETTYAIDDGRRVKRRLPSDRALLVDGLHPGIVDPALYERVQAMFAAHDKRPKNAMAAVANPLAGLVYCAECGRAMQLKGDPARRAGFLSCRTQGCPTCSTSVDVVVGVVLDVLRAWVAGHEAAPIAPAPAAGGVSGTAARARMAAHLSALLEQSDRLYDLLERGLYDDRTYLERRARLDAQLRDARAALAAIDARPAADPVAAAVPQARRVLDAYACAPDPAAQNALLRSVIARIVYAKLRRCYRGSAPTDHLRLTVYPRVPSAPVDPD